MKAAKELVITPPNIGQCILRIVGTKPYVQNKFSDEAKNEMRAKMEAGDKAKKGKNRTERDFKEDYIGALHVSTEGWYGFPSTVFRQAIVSACRLANLTMTRMKLAIDVVPDGFDKDGIPMTRIVKGEPREFLSYVRNSNGSCDLRNRPMWDAGWEADATIEYDADALDATDIANLLMRAGKQVGIGAGRNDSSKSCGCGWGSFTLKEGSK